MASNRMSPNRLLIDRAELSASELKQKQGELLARVYTLILSPEWQTETPSAPTLKRQVKGPTPEPTPETK